MRVRKIGQPTTEPHVRIPNTIARGGLSLEAIGLYTYLASAPDGWEIGIRHGRPWPTGYRVTLAALAELRGRGLVSETRRKKLADGKFEYVIDVYTTNAGRA